MKFEDFVNEVREGLKDEKDIDRSDFEKKVEEVAASIGRGARISKEKLDDWATKAKQAWPEVRKGLEELGEGFMRTLESFGEAFRRGYEDEDR
jgi:hypothetical protein